MKKRMIAMALAPLAIAVIAFAVIGGGSSEARQAPPPSVPAAVASQEVCPEGAGTADDQCGYPVHECFWILKAEGEGAYPNERVTLTTNTYGEDRVIVDRLAWMCESGYKFRYIDAGPMGQDVEVQGGKTKVYACYYISYGDLVMQWESIATDNFGTDRVLVVKSQVMCERAKKYHEGNGTVSDEDPEAEGNYGSKIWQCFNLHAYPRLRPFGIWTNNFDWQSIWVMNGYQLCEDAQKEHDEYVGGEPNGNIRECFRIEQRSPVWIPEWVTLETKNFGEVDALIGRPMLMCENAWWAKDG